MIKTVLFDLDGTLLPLWQEEFVKVYFGELCKRLATLGFEPQKTVDSIWAGTKAMVKNDGSRLNEELFWEVFRGMNAELPDAKDVCADFYDNEFNKVQSILKYNADRRALIGRLRAAGLGVVLATNPVFPTNAISTRLKWVGLGYEDFDYVTDYTNSCFSKPNPAYFREIAQKLSLDPAECLMVGNNVSEDMAAEAAGMKVFLVPEFLENPAAAEYSAFPQGTLDEAADYALSLAKE